MATIFGKKTHSVPRGFPEFDQHTLVSRGAALLPQSTTQNIFQVRGGRVKVKLLVGQVTTIIQNSDPVMKVTSIAKDAAGVTVGTAVDIASTVDITSDEVGTMYVVEGDGTALVASNAGSALGGATNWTWICPQGFIYLTTGASKSGAIKWDLQYEPLDPGADVVAVALSATGT